MSPPDGERVVRDGALTAQSLRDALADEAQRGRPVGMLAVGSDVLRVIAGRIVMSPDAMSDLRVAMPLVEIDPRLGSREWELREGSTVDRP